MRGSLLFLSFVLTGVSGYAHAGGTVAVRSEAVSSSSAETHVFKKGTAPDPGAAPNVRNVSQAHEQPQNCWLTVAQKYNIPTYLLFAIAMVESELNPTAINRNTNKKSCIHVKDSIAFVFKSEICP